MREMCLIETAQEMATKMIKVMGDLALLNMLKRRFRGLTPVSISIEDKSMVTNQNRHSL